MSEPEQLLISVDEARRIILDAVRQVDSELVKLDESVGRILSTDVVSMENIPPFDNSAMDGYAIRTNGIQGATTILDVVGEIPCGVTPSHKLMPTECMRIMTGAQIPDGSDAVLQQELVTRTNDQIQFAVPVAVGANIRMTGSNVREGETVVLRGTTVTPGVVGMLASVGMGDVPVVRRPRVAVFSSGDELVGVDEFPGPSQIRNSNGPALSAQVRASGSEVVYAGVLRDNVESIRTQIDRCTNQADVDVLVISGGASVGDYDLVRQELESMGMRVPFWKIRQRPGKPMAFGLLGDVPVFMLPGNPVSASICFLQYVRPFLFRMMDSVVSHPRLVSARFSGTIEKHRDLYYFARGHASVDDRGTTIVQVAGRQGSHVSQSLVTANCIMHLPGQTDAPSDGSIISIEWLDW